MHHHVFPPIPSDAALAGEKSIGYHIPDENMPWTPEVSLRAMDALGIDIAVLSLPTGMPPGPVGAENRGMARKLNEMLAKVSKDHSKRFGWFAATPVLFDTEGSLAEIAYALDVLGADGVGLSACYGEGKDAGQ